MNCTCLLQATKPEGCKGCLHMPSSQSLHSNHWGLQLWRWYRRKEKIGRIKTPFLLILISTSPGQRGPRSGWCLVRGASLDTASASLTTWLLIILGSPWHEQQALVASKGRAESINRITLCPFQDKYPACNLLCNSLLIYPGVPVSPCQLLVAVSSESLGHLGTANIVRYLWHSYLIGSEL